MAKYVENTGRRQVGFFGCLFVCLLIISFVCSYSSDNIFGHKRQAGTLDMFVALSSSF